MNERIAIAETKLSEIANRQLEFLKFNERMAQNIDKVANTVGELSVSVAVISDYVKRQDPYIVTVVQEVHDVKREVAVLRIKAGIWGFLAGAIPGAAATIFLLVHKP